MMDYPGISKRYPSASVDHATLLRLLDAEMLESVGQPVPVDEFEPKVLDDVPQLAVAAGRFLPIASVGLVVSVLSVLILAHFSGM